MQLKKWFVSLLAVAVGSVAFALPSPQDEATPFDVQMEQQVLPPLQKLITAAQKFGESEVEELPADQEITLKTHYDDFVTALNEVVSPVVDQIGVETFNSQTKTFMETIGLPMEGELTKENCMLLLSLSYFAMTGKLTEEQLEIAMLIFSSDDQQD